MITIFSGRKLSLDGTEDTVSAQVSVALRDKIHCFNTGKSCNPFAVFMAIALHTDQYGWAWPGRPRLSKETGIKSAIGNSIKHLCEMRIEGYRVLTCWRERKDGGLWGRTLYRIFPDAWKGEVEFPDAFEAETMIAWDFSQPSPHNPGVDDLPVNQPELEDLAYKNNQSLEPEPSKENPPAAISLPDTETTIIHPDGTRTTYHGGTFDADGNPNLPPPFTGTPDANEWPGSGNRLVVHDLNQPPEDATLWPDDRPPTQPAQPHSAEQVKAGVRKALETFSSTGGRAGVADPTKSEWANTDLMMAFSVVTGTPWDEVKPSSLKDWPGQFDEWASTWKERAPSVDDTIKCVRGIMESEHNWKTWTSPRSPSFQEVLDIMLGRYRAGRPWQKDGKKNGGASTPRQEQAIASDTIVMG